MNQQPPRPVNGQASPLPSPEQAQRRPHLCFGGDLACSGCMPCTNCMIVTRDVVISHVLAATQAITTPEQAIAAYQAYQTTAWQMMADLMMRHPAFVNRFTQTPVHALLAEVTALRQEVSVLRPLAGNLIQGEVIDTSLVEPVEAPIPAQANEESQLPVSVVAVASEPIVTPHSSQPQEPVSVSLPEITVEDVIAAAVPAPTKGVSLGSVMQVPPELQHQLDEIQGKRG